MAHKTITVKGDPTRKEYAAAAAITPGHLLELDTAGDVQKHSGSAGVAGAFFALENDLEGKEIGDAYVAGERVQTGVFHNGEEVYAWLAAGETVTIGADLSSNGDGTLQAGSTNSVATALEAVDLSASGAVDTRILVEVL